MIPVELVRRLDVSAASGLVVVGDRMYVVADDDLALAIYDLDGRRIDRVALLPGALPEDAKERKRLKPDLEALALIAPDRLVALGSGSKPNRMRGAAVTIGAQTPEVAPIDLAPLYRAIEGTVGRVNIEGAAVSRDRLVLLQRREPHAAIVDLARARDARVWDASLLVDVRRIELGASGGIPLGFTDASPLPDGRIVFSAAAEDTDDPYEDGPCLGSVVGVLDPRGAVLDLEPIDVAAKIEGVHAALAPDGSIDLVLVADADDPAIPSPLFRARMTPPPAR
jgi:hypothetical protein